MSNPDLSKLADSDLLFLDAEQKWLERARTKQILPIDGWSIIVSKSGRGAGKTLTGANWVRREAGMMPGVVVHVVAPSHADLIGTVMQGSSGILAVTPPELIEATNTSAAIPTIKFKNGTLIRGFSAQSPERLRGPQCNRLWGDECAAWGANGPETLRQIDLSTRIAYRGSNGKLIQPAKFFTSTPKPLQWFKELTERADQVITDATHANKANLAESFLRDLEVYAGTAIYRQEVLGELIDVSESAIIRQSWLKIWPNSKPLPWFEFIIVGLDTAYTEKSYDKKSMEADPTACQVWGVFIHERRWNLMLLERWSDHVGFPELVRRAKKELARTYGRRSEILFTPLIGQSMHAEQVKRPDLLLIEDKGSGISLRQMLATEGIDSYPYNPGKADKLARLHAVSHVAANGRIWLPESTKEGPEHRGQPRNWVTPMLDEVCVYSGEGTTAHDDEVDVASMCWRFFADRWMTAGVDGKIGKEDTVVNVSSGLLGEEWIEGEDRLPGYVPQDDFVNPYYG